MNKLESSSKRNISEARKIENDIDFQIYKKYDQIKLNDLQDQ